MFVKIFYHVRICFRIIYLRDKALVPADIVDGNGWVDVRGSPNRAYMGSPGALDALLGMFHMAFCSGWARIEIFCHPVCSKIGAPFEVPALYHFEKSEIWWLHSD